MESAELENALRDFANVATIVRDEPGRQLWRFQFNGRGYFLRFYPRISGIERFWRSGSAVSEFLRLQTLQKAKVPVPRAAAHLSGLKIADTIGDAVITEEIPYSVQLDRYLQDHLLHAASIPQHREIVRQIVQIIEGIGRAKFGVNGLSLGSFLLSDGRVYLHDVAPLRAGGLKLNDVFAFAHEAARFATRTDLLRGWRWLNPDFPIPRQNPINPVLWKRFVRESRHPSERIGQLQAGEWTGWFTRASRWAQPWSHASQLAIHSKDWDSAWPKLLQQMESGQLSTIKSDASGGVYAAEVVLNGRPVPVIVKRPRRTVWYRYLIDLFRAARTERMWLKAWMLIGRNLPCEWPMLLMQRKRMGYVTDGVIVFERVPGEPLYKVDLDSMPSIQRDRLFRRAGRILRIIEQSGLVHYDSKSTNWIVYQSAEHGAIPVMIDVDSIRPLNFWLQGWGIARLLRAMKLHKQYTPADSLALCQGYAPRAGVIQPEDEPASPQ